MEKKVDKVLSVPHYIRLQLNNNATERVTLKWNQDREDKELDILPGTKSRKDILVLGDQRFVPLEFSAIEKKRNIPVTLNGELNLRICASEEVFLMNVVFNEVPYRIQLQLENNASSTVVLKWEDNQEGRELCIPSQTKSCKDILVTGESRFVPLEFTALEKDGNIPVTINGKENIRIFASHKEFSTKVVFEEVPHYIRLQLNNNATERVTLKWNQDREDKELDILPGTKSRKDILVLGDQRFVPLEFSAIEKKTNIPVTLNGELNLRICASEEIFLMNVVFNEVPYRIQLHILNKATCKVVLKWKENEEEKELNISSQTRKEKDIFVTGEKRFVPLEFSATEKDKNIPVTINGEQSIRISATKEIYPTIIILEEVPYRIQLQLENNASSTVVLKWEVNQEGRELCIPSQTKSCKDIMVTRENRFVPLKFTALEKHGNIPVTINGKENIRIFASHEEFWTRVVFEEVPYYIPLQLKNKSSLAVILKWKQVYQVQELDILPGAKKVRYVSFTGEMRFMNFEFSAVERESNTVVTVNGQKILTLSPSRQLELTTVLLEEGPKQIQLQPENKSSGDVHPKRKQSNGELDIPPEARIDRYKSGTEDMGFSSFQYNVMEQEGNNFVTINGKEHLALSPTRQHILTEVILEKGILTNALSLESHYILVEEDWFSLYRTNTFLGAADNIMARYF